MNRAPVIDVNGLAKNYGSLRAVDGISFQVMEGEIFGLLGPNGSGKTTTIRMLVGLTRPTEGHASILGKDISTGMVDVKRHIGVVPDISNLYEELSARDNLLFMAKLYGIPKASRESRADHLLRAFGLYDRKDDRFGTFSRGMKRALTIAVALVHNPRILFLDEPTVGLDVVAARSLRKLIRDLHHQGLTVILTTHYLEEADQLCDRIAVLVKGQIVKLGTAEELKAQARGQPTVEIRFSQEIGSLIEELSRRLPHYQIQIMDLHRVRIFGDHPGKIFQEVTDFSKEMHVDMETVNTITPTLEDAFIDITGLSPAIMIQEKGGK